MCAAVIIIKANKSNRIRWNVYVARIEKMRNASRTLVGKSEGKGRHLEELGTDEKISE
jgi:hypothetical protein